MSCACFSFLSTKAALGDSLWCRCLPRRCQNAIKLILPGCFNSLMCSVPEIKGCLTLSSIFLFLRLFLAPAGQLVPTFNGYFSMSEFYICLITLIRHIKCLANGCVSPIWECQGHLSWCRHFPSCCAAV